jgi:molecular chaperone GrpE
MDRERTAWQARALEGFVLDLLPVVDSFDRALPETGHEPGSPDALLDGMRLVHKQLLDALARHGIEPVPALGEPFDPSLHEAFMSRPAGEGEAPDTIVEEFLKGYRMGDRIIRPTKGIVASAPDTDDDAGPEEV